MFTSREMKAMAFGYAFSVPLGGAAIYFGAPVIAAVPTLMIGFLVTLFWLNLSD